MRIVVLCGGPRPWRRTGPDQWGAASAVVLLPALVGVVGHLDVLVAVLGLELGDVLVPLGERPLAQDELQRLLVDVVAQRGLPERDLLALLGAERVRRRGRPDLALVHRLLEL